MSSGFFDSDTFFSVLDSERQSRNFTWKKVAEESGISASTLTRIAQGKHPDVDSLGALCVWAGVDANGFFKNEGAVSKADTLAEITANLRADKKLSPEGMVAIETMLKSAYNAFRNDKD